MDQLQHKFFAQKYLTFEQTVIVPAVHRTTTPLTIECCRVDGEIRPEHAPSLSYTPVSIGHRWGPPLARAWFRLTGSINPAQLHESIVLRFDPGTEALIYNGPEPWQGLDTNRTDARLPKSVFLSRGRVEIYVEAECMHPWGIRAFAWDTTETHKRWASQDPGHVTLAELAHFEEGAWKLSSAFRFARQLFGELDPADPLADELMQALDDATRLIDDRDVPRTAERARERLMRCLVSGADPCAGRVLAAGHAHIDTAWLWTLDHTRRKCLRSWSNVVRLAERFPEFPFICSQAAQYEMVAAVAPGLMEKVADLVRAGRWQPLGAMWVEPDCNVPSGESLVRQVLEGVRAWTDRLGPGLDHRTAFLPDTFGFPASLPGIFRACGIDSFITNKMSWNQTNQMTHTNFVWRGLGGAEVLAHLTPGGDYNSSNTPKEILRGKAKAAGTPPSEIWFQPFGFGDGGGGPTDWQIENARLAARCPSLPAIELGSALAFTEMLRDSAQKAEASGKPWPVWEGELYLELHRGTLTTQSKLKHLNAQAEHALREAEIAQALTGNSTSAKLRPHWRTLLTNQFHDILPGSSICEVNEQAERELADVCTAAETEFSASLTRRPDSMLCVWNPASTPGSGVVETPTGLVHVESAPPVSARPIAVTPPFAPATGDERTLSNSLIEARLAPCGCIASLAEIGRASVCSEPIHVYRLYRDRPHMWDAWDIDPGYERDEIALLAQCSFEVVEDHPLRRTIRVRRRLTDRASVVTSYTLAAGSPALEVVMDIDWQEDHRLLRVLYPTRIEAHEATFGIQFGSIARSTRRESSWDKAKFECAVHRYLDLSQPGAGLAVLAPSTFGASAEGRTLGLSLLRSPTHPDPHADRGTHRIRLGLAPHAGDLRAARIPALAERFARPMRCLPNGTHLGGFAFECTGGAEVELAALKPAENPGAIVARFAELHGSPGTLSVKWPGGIGRIEVTDAIESRVLGRIDPDEPIPLSPYQILTLRAIFKE